MPKPARRHHHQHPPIVRVQLVMTKAEWFWAVLLWAGVTVFMIIAIWLNIGTH
jgi:hypothetical protein